MSIVRLMMNFIFCWRVDELVTVGDVSLAVSPTLHCYQHTLEKVRVGSQLQLKVPCLRC